MNLIKHNFNGKSIRIILIDNNPWFVANDVTAVLGLSNSRKAISDLFNRLDKADISKEGITRSYTLQTKGGNQKTTLLSEIGLYELIFASKKEEAIRFRYWVTSEVLPSIRKTGSYSTKPKEDIDLDSIRKRTEQIKLSTEQLIDYKKSFHEIGIKREEELIVTANRAVAKETGVDFIELAELKGVSTPDRYFTVTELCQKVMNSDKFDEEAKKLVSTKAGDKPRPQNLNKLLETNGFQNKVDDIWKPTEKAKDLADFVQNKSNYSEKTVFHTVWKIEILEEIL